MENIEIFNFEYNLSKEDYLNYFLYNANHSKTVINNRKKTFLFLIFFVIAMLIIVNINHFDILQNILLIIFYTILLYGFQYYVKIRYIKHYKKYIDEKLSARTGKNFFVEFQNEKLIGKEGNSESSLSYKDFNEIVEIDNYIFVKIFSTETLIFPKNINVFEKIKSNLLVISKNYNIPYKEELNWKFK